MSLQCDQPSLIYWAIGVSPSLNDLTLKEIKEKLYTSDGLKSNYSLPDDPFSWRLYGSEIVDASIPTPKNFSSLRSNSLYQIKYYCVNQLNKISDPVIATWRVPCKNNNLNYLF